MLELNENIREILRERKLTQKQLAENLGISECSMSRYLKGTRIPVEKDRRLSGGLPEGMVSRKLRFE